MHINNNKTLIWDVGGHASMRSIWSKYYKDAHGIVFVVDAADPCRFAECAEIFQSVLSHPETTKLPVLLFSNKHDLSEMVISSDEEVMEGLKIQPYIAHRKFRLQQCSGLTWYG